MTDPRRRRAPRARASTVLAALLGAAALLLPLDAAFSDGSSPPDAVVLPASEEVPPAGPAPVVEAGTDPACAPEAAAEPEEAESADEEKTETEKAEEEKTEEESEEAEEEEEGEKEEEEKAPKPDVVPFCPPPPPPCWHGSVEVRIRARFDTAEDEHDVDLYEYLRLRYREERGTGWSAAVYGRLAQDLDGDVDRDGFFVFDSVDDSFGSWFTWRLYHAYANYRPRSGVLEEVRIGRQSVDAGEYLLFDGVRATFDPRADRRGLRFEAYGGVPAHLYESSPKGDGMGGVGVLAEPWHCAEVRAHYTYLRDENRWYGTEEANLFTVSWFQRLREYTSVRASYQQVDDDPRVLSAAFDTWFPRADVTLRGTFRTQLSTERALVFDIDPYYAIAGELDPYWDLHLAASKGLGRCVVVEAGGSIRRLYESQDEGEFNREFERVYAMVSTSRWPARTVGLSVTGEWWESQGEDVGALSFEASWQPTRRWRFSAGTDYALYRTDLYSASERLDSRGVFVKAEWRPTRRWRLFGDVRWEEDDFDTYWRLQAGARVDF